MQKIIDEISESISNLDVYKKREEGIVSSS